MASTGRADDALSVGRIPEGVALLVGIGWWHRRSTLPALEAGRARAFWRLAAVEIVVMAATVGLAVALSRTP